MKAHDKFSKLAVSVITASLLLSLTTLAKAESDAGGQSAPRPPLCPLSG
ncbi:MAG: hypothetical protein ABSD75_31720 [Terriglobales bacterium]|jgi:hypothetical protein